MLELSSWKHKIRRIIFMNAFFQVGHKYFILNSKNKEKYSSLYITKVNSKKPSYFDWGMQKTCSNFFQVQVVLWTQLMLYENFVINTLEPWMSCMFKNFDQEDAWKYHAKQNRGVLRTEKLVSLPKTVNNFIWIKRLLKVTVWFV